MFNNPNNVTNNMKSCLIIKDQNIFLNFRVKSIQFIEKSIPRYNSEIKHKYKLAYNEVNVVRF